MTRTTNISSEQIAISIFFFVLNFIYLQHTLESLRGIYVEYTFRILSISLIILAVIWLCVISLTALTFTNKFKSEYYYKIYDILYTIAIYSTIFGIISLSVAYILIFNVI